MRAVNQGIGRVIRHINDYGIILMLDNRYDQSKLKSMLPTWAKENMKSYDYFEDIDEKMRGFFT
jgi:regulator of telomere elongation helicase 1